MKARCIESHDGKYIFNIESKDVPIVGAVYNLEDATTGTLAQNKAIHALIGEYFKSGVHPTKGGEPYDVLRNHIKYKLGAGMEKFHYGYFKGNLMEKGEAENWEDIPKECRRLYKIDQAFIVGKLKSISKYTKRERMNLIDNLINDMTAAGVKSKKFYEIVEGMNNGN